MLIGLVKSFCI